MKKKKKITHRIYSGSALTSLRPLYILLIILWKLIQSRISLNISVVWQQWRIQYSILPKRSQKMPSSGLFIADFVRRVVVTRGTNPENIGSHRCRWGNSQISRCGQVSRSPWKSDRANGENQSKWRLGTRVAGSVHLGSPKTSSCLNRLEASLCIRGSDRSVLGSSVCMDRVV